MQKIDHKLFINMLKAKGITQKAFAQYAKIPYDTVTGWKKKGKVPAYAAVILKQMPHRKETVTAADLIEAGLPRAVLWNAQSDKEVPVDIFIVSTLQKAYNDFVIDILAEYFGKESILAALLTYKERISKRLAQQVAQHLQELPKSA